MKEMKDDKDRKEMKEMKDVKDIFSRHSLFSSVIPAQAGRLGVLRINKVSRTKHE